jgi:hypothetical protein
VIGRRGWLAGLLAMTYPGLGGQQQSPVNAPAGQATAPGIQPGVSGGVVRARQVIVSDDIPGDGLFVYSGQGAAGNAPIFWAGGGGTDPFGNSLPSTAGVAGSGTFQAGNTIMNPDGVFTYSPSPGAGNLVQSSGTTANGTDAYGNHYIQGNATYGGDVASVTEGGAFIYLSGSLSGGWSELGALASDGSGDLISTMPGTLELGGGLAVAGDGQVTGNLTLTTINGSSDTGTALPAGVPTGGPNSGTFAGHTHDFDGHTHAI